jgi:hypothetical protein
MILIITLYIIEKAQEEQSKLDRLCAPLFAKLQCSNLMQMNDVSKVLLHVHNNYEQVFFGLNSLFLYQMCTISF